MELYVKMRSHFYIYNESQVSGHNHMDIKGIWQIQLELDRLGWYFFTS